MSMNHPWILFVTTDLPDEGSAFRMALSRLGKAIEDRGIQVVQAMSGEDGLAIARGKPSYSAVAIDWDLGETGTMAEESAMKIVRAVREKSLKVPIFLLTRSIETPDLPMSLVAEVREYVNVGSETPLGMPSPRGRIASTADA